MDIKIKKEGPWRVGGNLRNFVIGQVLEVGVDVPDNIAEDMLRCDYADKMDGMPNIETKNEAPHFNGIDDHIELPSTEKEKKSLKKKKKKKNRS